MSTYKSKKITAADQFTDYISIARGGAVVVVEDTSSMSMTVVLQIRQDRDSDPIDTGDTWTTEGAHVIEGVPDIEMRVGVKTGGYASGTANVRIYRKQ